MDHHDALVGGNAAFKVLWVDHHRSPGRCRRKTICAPVRSEAVAVAQKVNVGHDHLATGAKPKRQSAISMAPEQEMGQENLSGAGDVRQAMPGLRKRPPPGRRLPEDQHRARARDRPLAGAMRDRWKGSRASARST